jgi:hypothetical protein
MLASIFIKAYCELLLVVCLVLHVFYFCNNTRLKCLPSFWQEATMNFYLLFELYCKLFVFATTLDFIANLHLHRTIASYRTNAFFKLLQVSTITSFFFFFPILYVVCVLLQVHYLCIIIRLHLHKILQHQCLFQYFSSFNCHLIWNNS